LSARYRLREIFFGRPVHGRLAFYQATLLIELIRRAGCAFEAAFFMIFNKGLKPAAAPRNPRRPGVSGAEAIAFVGEKAISGVSCEQDIS